VRFSILLLWCCVLFLVIEHQQIPTTDTPILYNLSLLYYQHRLMFNFDQFVRKTMNLHRNTMKYIGFQFATLSTTVFCRARYRMHGHTFNRSGNVVETYLPAVNLLSQRYLLVLCSKFHWEYHKAMSV
jgi:hypothetical protein